MNLTKKQERQIITAYSVTRTEYDLKKPGFYYHRGLHSGITILPGETERDAVMVTRTDSQGRIRFRDRWKIGKDGDMLFVSSNPADMPLSDTQVIADLEREVEELKAAGRRLETENEGLRREVEELRNKHGKPTT